MAIFPRVFVSGLLAGAKSLLVRLQTGYDSKPILSVGQEITATPRRSPSPIIAYDGVIMTATPRR